MKRTKEELIEILKANSEGLGDNLIGLLEDVSDSFEDNGFNVDDYVLKSEFEKKSAEYDELKQKYIDRFSGKVEENGDPVIKEDEVVETPEETPEEESEVSLEDIVADFVG